MYHRNVLKQIIPYLQLHDILLFYGSRQVGKTSLMQLIQKEYINTRSITFDLENPGHLELLNKGPDIFINNLESVRGWEKNENITIFIDEIQYLDEPTSFLKYIHDHYKNIKFIVSGSSTLEIRGKFKDSLAGRLLKFNIYPLGFDEFLIFKGKDDLASVVKKSSKGDVPDYITAQIMEYYKEYITFGGYPRIALTNGLQYKKALLKQLYESYINKDIKDIGKIKDINGFNNLLKLLASQVGNLVNYSEISNKLGINLETLKRWITILENTFIIKNILPYVGNLRGEIIKAPKLFFIDPGIRNFCINEYEITGSLFENGFFSFITNSGSAKKINFYRTKDKQEIDFIIDNIPYELKMKYTGTGLTTLSNFEKKLNIKGKVITLDKSQNKGREAFYPWEIPNLEYSNEY